MKLIVAGSRTFTDYALLEKYLDAIHRTHHIHEVICGMARGADLFGKVWAESRRVLVREMPADWNTHGKRAGYLRNEEMAKVATHLIAFWDGESRGTQHMIEIANRTGLKTKIIRV